MAAYPLYLLCFGPVYALIGNGYLDFLPQKVRDGAFLTTAPIYLMLGPRNFFDDYLTWWYDDPNAAETTW
jgi:hypothetical protein